MFIDDGDGNFFEISWIGICHCYAILLLGV
jgi:hypothetical protein